MQLKNNGNYHTRLLTAVTITTVTAIGLALYKGELWQWAIFWCVLMMVAVVQKFTSRIIVESTSVTIHYCQWTSERQIVIPIQKASATIKKVVEFRGGQYWQLRIFDNNVKKHAVDSRSGFDVDKMQTLCDHINNMHRRSTLESMGQKTNTGS